MISMVLHSNAPFLQETAKGKIVRHPAKLSKILAKKQHQNNNVKK